MMGNLKKTEPKLFYHGVSLEQRVPKDDPLRKIKQLVDFNFIRSQVADLYGVRGNPSVDPGVILKLMFLLFYENVKSERALMQKLPMRMDWLWFCDYDLDEETPNHSVLSKARKRWGPKIFEQFFMNILEQCVAAGLIDGETIYMDSSTIDGNADIEKVRPQLRMLSEELSEKLDEADETDQNQSCEDEELSGKLDETDETDQNQSCEDEELSEKLDEADETGQNPFCEDNSEQDKLAKRVNPTDPDARIGRKYGKSTLGYKDHRVTDDKHGVITATITTPANLNDDKVLKQLVQTHEANTAIEAKTVTADKIYGTIENYKYLDGKGAKACIPHQKHGSKEVGKFSHDKFRYDKKQDCYICPAGEKLKRYDQTGTHSSGHRYRADRKTCEQCKLFKQCVTSKNQGRQVSRNIDAEYVEWADNCLSPYQRKQLLSRRKYKSEGSFADATNNYGFKRARWRGRNKMQIQNLLIAAIQNLGKLLRYGNSGDKFTTSPTINKALFGPIFRFRDLLSSLFATRERILSYQRTIPVNPG